jgi:hypothetical protein
MSGLMRRLTRGRAATADETAPQPGASQPVGAADAQQGGSAVPASPDGATAVLPVTGETAQATAIGTTTEPAAPTADLPAGIDPAELASAPDSAARRGTLRRRLRYLAQVRELLLRDLGGFVAEALRSDQGLDSRRGIVDAKARRLAAVDAETRELESRLGRPHRETVLRRPGVGGTCPECGELHASDARFCSRCGTPLTGRAATAVRAATPAPATPTVANGDSAKESTASLWGRPKRPVQASVPPPATPPVARRTGEPEAAEPETAEADTAEPEATTGGERA